jgi:DNA-binding GntR family transcriptional regulator
MTALDGRAATRVGVAGGEEWLMVRGFRYADDDDVPACQTEYYINREFAAVGRLLQRHNGPIFPLIEDLFGLSIIEVDQEIGATVLPASLAETLKVKEGSAALEIRRSYRIDDGRIAQVTLSTFPAARYRHSMTLRRVKA